MVCVTVLYIQLAPVARQRWVYVAILGVYVGDLYLLLIAPAGLHVFKDRARPQPHLFVTDLPLAALRRLRRAAADGEDRAACRAAAHRHVAARSPSQSPQLLPCGNTTQAPPLSFCSKRLIPRTRTRLRRGRRPSSTKLPINVCHHFRKRAALRQAGINAFDPLLNLFLPRRLHVSLSCRFTPLQRRAGQSHMLIMSQLQGILRDLGQFRTHCFSVSTPETVSRMAFFAANTMIRWIGGFLEIWPTTNFSLLHAAFAAGSGLCFVLFKFVAQRQLQTEPA